jgi:hypothetical protein
MSLGVARTSLASMQLQVQLHLWRISTVCEGMPALLFFDV